MTTPWGDSNSVGKPVRASKVSMGAKGILNITTPSTGACALAPPYTGAATYKPRSCDCDPMAAYTLTRPCMAC